jgi:[ribosomal protein S18]-alanine N-acetyltransferase
MTTAGLRVRTAMVEDLPSIVEMEESIGEAPHWPKAEYAAIVSADQDMRTTISRCLMVAETEGHLLGFAVGKIIGSGSKSIAELESVAVRESARRGGVGRALCEAVIDWCTEWGVGVMELEVRSGSGGAITLYKELGFAIVGRRKGYYREPIEDALLMKLELAGRQ